MSSWRSRSAGSVGVTTFRRWNKSSRNRPTGTLLFEISVRGGNQADIRLAFARFAESFIGPIVEEPEEPGLSVERQVTNLIEQQRPPSSSWTLPATSAIAPVKAPLR